MFSELYIQKIFRNNLVYPDLKGDNYLDFLIIIFTYETLFLLKIGPT